MSKIVVTGGAGFIGSHLIDALVARGHDVVAFDSLDPAAHPQPPAWPEYANPGARYVRGDVLDREALRAVLRGAEVVFHYAAAVGSGISMVQIKRFVENNTVGTAQLLELLLEPGSTVRKLIVASSMTAMGEGTYLCDRDGIQYPPLRPLAQLERHQWELLCPVCGRELSPIAMSEVRPLMPVSIYGMSKKDQEEECLLIGQAYRLPVVAFRYFSVYGPRQSLTNPYTGVIARFGTRLMLGMPAIVYEDGRQLKDVIHVQDVVSANLRAMESDGGDYEVFNLGSGVAISVARMAELLARRFPNAPATVFSGQFRAGDARHGWADIGKAQKQLGWTPAWMPERGFEDLSAWLETLPADTVRAAAQAYENAERAAEAGRGNL